MVQVDSSISAATLYTRAKIWMAKTYVSANAVIQVDDKEAGKLLGKGMFTVYLNTLFIRYPSNINVHHTVSISVKGGKYMYNITDLNATWYTSASAVGSSVFGGYNNERILDNKLYNKGKAFNVKLCKGTDEKVKDLIMSLKMAMIKPEVDNF